MSTGEVNRQARALISRIKNKPNLMPKERDEGVAWLRKPGHEERFLLVLADELPLNPAAQSVIDQLLRRARATHDGLITWLPSVPGLPSPAELLLSRPWRNVDTTMSLRPLVSKCVAAMAAVAIAAGAFVYLTPSGKSPVRAPSIQTTLAKCQTHTTQVGKQQSVLLVDGSTILLNSGTSLVACINSHERRLWLNGGEARFTVAPDQSRPFVVNTDDIRAEAVGTVFDVYRGQRSRVTVLEGVVKVNAVSTLKDVLFMVSAGTQAEATLEGDIQLLTGEEYSRALEWARHRVTFRGESMGEVLAELNRYSPTRIYIADPRVKKARVRGSIPTDDPQKILKMLELQDHIRTERDANGGTALHWEE